MKQRKVIVTIECETDAPVKELRKKYNWMAYCHDRHYYYRFFVNQIQVNVIKAASK